MQVLDLVEAPPERGDRLRHVEQGLRQGIALMLIGLERARSSIQDRAGQQLRVPECVGYAVGGQRVFEVTGIADERPTGAVRLPEMPGTPAKPRRRPTRRARLTSPLRCGEFAARTLRKAPSTFP